MQQFQATPKSLFYHWQLKGWMLWALAALFYAYEFIHRVAPGVLTNQIREVFAANDHQLAIIGAMYLYGYALFQIPAGILIDRYGVKKVLVIASSILTLGSFLFTMTTSSGIAHASRFMIGAGSAFAFIGCLKIGSQWLANSSFPLVVGLTNLCGTLGALSAGAPLSLLVNKIGWREALIQLSFIGLLITLLLGLFLQEKKTPVSLKQPKLLTGLILIVKTPYSWLIALYGALLVAPIAALPELWGVEYLQIAYQISGTQAAAITHTIFIGTATGGTLIGWLIVRLALDETKLMAIASLGALLLLLIFLFLPTLPLTYLYAILFGYGILTANMLLCFSLMSKTYPAWAQGVAISFTNTIIMTFSGLVQDRVGWMLRKLHALHQGVYLVEDYQIALSILPVCLLFAIGLTFFIKKLKPSYQ